MTSDISAVVCTYTEERWEQFVAAVTSLQAQSPPPREVLVVVDHAPELLERVRRELAGVRAVENTEPQGLSGGRNTALRTAEAPLVSFLDDDAVAEPGWLARLGAHLEDPHVLAVGSRVTPRWADRRPGWFPEEFDWVVGCSYRGLPEHPSEVRNPFGGAMIIRRREALAAGGFRRDLGRVGKAPAACEETELCVRLSRIDPTATFVYDPGAEVHHVVPRERCTWRYFRRRCFAEGGTKAFIHVLAGPDADALRTERAYVRTALAKGFLGGFVDASRGRWSGLGRAGVIVAGLAWTTAGFAVGQAAARRSRDRSPSSTRWVRPSQRAGGAAFDPLWVGEVDLDAPPRDLIAPRSPSGIPYRRAAVVVWAHHQPVGTVTVRLCDGRVPAMVLHDRVRAELADDLAAQGNEEARADPACSSLGADGRLLPSCSVVLCTRDRPDQAELAIRQLLTLDYPAFEIVVVDNAPSDGTTERIVRELAGEDARVRYVREEVPGLASARNRGVAAARGELVAFTDDDIRVSAGWLRALSQGFERTPKVVCVTGSVLAAALDTAADQHFDQAVPAVAKWGFAPRLFRSDDPPPASPLFPYQVGIYGGGGNAAFTRQYLVESGGFDPALGAGTRCHGGEDLDAFLRVLASGDHIAYEPSALVWHLHHTDDQLIRRQAFRYGVALGAFLFKIAVSRAHARPMLTRSPQGVHYLLSRSSEKNAQKSAAYPTSLVLLELSGIAWGPVAYLRSRRQVARQLPSNPLSVT